MIITEKTTEFDKWIRKLKDIRAKSKILFRIQKLETNEHFGDCKPVGDGISEMKINYAKGYRVYFKEKGQQDCYSSNWRRQIDSTKRYRKSEKNLEQNKK